MNFENMTLEELKQEQLKDLKFDPENYDECLEVVKQYGMNLKFVKNQTPEICLEAVKQCGLALSYVKEQTQEICIEAVKQDGCALELVREQTPEICLEAVKHDGMCLQFVIEQTPEICFVALKENPDALIYVKDLTMLKPMKVFISVGMTGRDAESVNRDLSLAKEDIIRRYGNNVLTIDNYSCVAPEGAGRLYYLGEAIKKLDGVDAVYFCKGWHMYRGCSIEREICKQYGIKIIESEV